MSSQGLKEELLGLLPLSRQTRGEDIANAVQKCLEDNGIDINKIASIATDVARNTTMKLDTLNLKLQGKGNPAYALLEEVVCFEKNYFFLLKTWRVHSFKKNEDGFAERFEQFKTNKSTLAFMVNPLNTNTNEINIGSFGINAGSLQMQLLDLKTKDLWSGKFTELKSKLEELEIQKCMHITQHKWTALK
ncbi:hypothetical protein AVEN_190702-1 [Araneus ventricosus]|uniref:DUF4371 domain-containing protein n=1 Tax=Araneus ventricosus TaxID=182803 RepID=A0A4Y2QVE9_ARAVE|nr:hypothetical protein AVEN_190702-1 [Araneus ventricosus]